jgi:hypothetical protein
VTPDGLPGLDARDFDMDTDVLERLTSSRKGFQEFVEGHWDHVLIVVFVFQVRPLNPGLQPFLIVAQRAKDGKARGDQIALLATLKEICAGTHRGGFATDGNPAYNAFHEEQAARNLAFFRKNPTDIPLKRHYRAFSDILHLLKCGRCRMLKKIRMVVGLDNNLIELDLQCLIDLLRDDLSPIVFSVIRSRKCMTLCQWFCFVLRSI